MPTRRVSSLVWISSALALGLVLGACTPGGQFDPTELLSSDVFTTKKKLAGEREPLFPNGVPGEEIGRAGGFGERVSAATGTAGGRQRRLRGSCA